MYLKSLNNVVMSGSANDILTVFIMSSGQLGAMFTQNSEDIPCPIQVSNWLSVYVCENLLI